MCPRKPERDSATTQPTTSSTRPVDRALAERWLPARSWQLPVCRGSLRPGCHPAPSISCRVRSSCPFSPPLAAGRCVRRPRGSLPALRSQDGTGCWGHLLWTDGKGLTRAVLSSDAMGARGVKAQTLTRSHTHVWLPRSPSGIPIPSTECFNCKHQVSPALQTRILVVTKSPLTSGRMLKW